MSSFIEKIDGDWTLQTLNANDIVTIDSVTTSVTGNLVVGNLNTAGQLYANGNITTESYFIGNFLGNIVGNLVVPGANTDVLFNLNGNAWAASGLTFDYVSNTLTSGNVISAVGNVIAGNVYTAGNVTGNYLIGNGAFITGLADAYSNANVENYLPVYTGNLVSLQGDVITTANITANYFLGNGSQLTGMYSNVDVAVYLPTYTGNLNPGNISVASTANIGAITLSASNSNITGVNFITANYFAGNGSLLTGVVATSIGILPSLSVTGNINTGNLLSDGAVTAAANVVGGNLITGGIVSASGAVSSLSNITGSNLLTSGIVSSTGNVLGGNLTTSGTVSAGGNIYAAGNLSITGRIEGSNVKIGTDAGSTGQSYNGIAVGLNAGSTNQGLNAVAIGYGAGETNQSANSIILNADTTALNSSQPGLYINPVRNDTTNIGNVVTYNVATKEITYTNTLSIGNITAGNASVTGNTVIDGDLSVTGNAYLSGNIVGDRIQNGNTVIDIQSLGGNANVSVGGVVNVAVFSPAGISLPGNVATGNLLTDNLLYANGEPWDLQSAVGSNSQVQYNLNGNFGASANLTFDNTGAGTLSVGYGVNGNIQTDNIYANASISSAGNITVASGKNIVMSGGNITGVGNITAGGNIKGNNFSATGNTVIDGDLSVTGNAYLSGNIIGDRIQNGTTVIDIQTPDGNANVSVGGVTNVAVFYTEGISLPGNVIAGNVLTDNLLYANGDPWDLQTPAGSNTQIQFNSNNDFGASANLTFDIDTNILSAGNIATAGTVSATGDITGGNILTTGLVSTSANVVGGNLITSGLISATSNITGGNIITAGSGGNISGANVIFGTTLSATSNVIGGNILTNGLISTAGNVVSGNINVSGGNIDGANVVLATTVSATGNVISGNLTTSGLITAQGNILASSLSLSGNITLDGRITGGNVKIAEDAGLINQGYNSIAIGINAGYTGQANNTIAIGTDAGKNNQAENSIILNANSSVLDTANAGFYVAPIRNDNLNTNNILTYNATTKELTYTETLSLAGNVNVGNIGFTNASATGNVVIDGDLTVTGNAYLSGNIVGDRIQNGNTIIDIQTQGGNANVSVGGVTNVAVFTPGGLSVTANVDSGNVNAVGDVSAIGNVTGAYILGNGSQLTGLVPTIVTNGTSNINIATPNGNVTVSVDGTGNIAVFSGQGLNLAGNLSVTGNVIGDYFIGNGTALTGVMADRGGDPNNWNTLTQMGVYTVNRVSWSGTVGTPLDSQVYVGLLEVKNSTGVALEQIFYPGTITTGNAKTQWNRNYWSGSWTPWLYVVNDDQVVVGGDF